MANRLNRKTFLGIFAAFLPSVLLASRPTIRKNSVITFTPEILTKHNTGLYLINDKASVIDNPDYAATVSWKITWNLGVVTNSLNGKRYIAAEWPKYSLTNFLTDGWTHPIGNNYEEVCKYLNNNPHGEKYRIMTKEELFYIINHRTNQKQLFYEHV